MKYMIAILILLMIPAVALANSLVLANKNQDPVIFRVDGVVQTGYISAGQHVGFDVEVGRHEVSATTEDGRWWPGCILINPGMGAAWEIAGPAIYKYGGSTHSPVTPLKENPYRGNRE